MTAHPTRPTTDPPAPSTADRDHLVRQLLVVVLAVNSGAIDAIGFVALGGAFSSVMTGNMVLLGISAAHADAALARHVGVALACFIIGCALGARMAGKPAARDSIWPGAVRRALAVELVATAAVLIGWEISGSDRSAGAQLALLGCNALALGLQSSAVQRFGVPGMSTTYLTGTLTTVVARLALREPVRQVGHSVSILAGLIGGAVVGALLADHAPQWAAALPVLLVGTAVLVPILRWRER